MSKYSDIQTTCQQQIASMGEEHGRELDLAISRIKEEHKREAKMMSLDHLRKLELECNRITAELQDFHHQQLRTRESEHFEKLEEERIRLTSGMRELEEAHQQDMKTIKIEHAQDLKEECERVKMEFGATHHHERARTTSEHAQKTGTEGAMNGLNMCELEVTHRHDVPEKLEQAQSLVVDHTSLQQQLKRTQTKNALELQAERAAHGKQVKEISDQHSQKVH